MEGLGITNREHSPSSSNGLRDGVVANVQANSKFKCPSDGCAEEDACKVEPAYPRKKSRSRSVFKTSFFDQGRCKMRLQTTAKIQKICPDGF